MPTSGCVAMAGALRRVVPLVAPTWSFDLQALSDAVTPRTKAILINSPHNPTGRVFSREELAALAAVCIDHDLTVFTDDPYEYITYAVGINANGTVKQIEILQYNESYGYEVREASWRAQFVGKSAGSTLQLNADIKNISGATLSCRHITDGVKRLLSLYELVLKH